MGAWGTSPLENDGVLDFLGDLGDSRKASRVALLRDALEGYASFHQRMLDGSTTTSMSEEEIQRMLASRDATLELNGPDVIDLLPELATPETWEGYVRELARPRVDEGSGEVERAVGAAWALASRYGLVDSRGQAHHMGSIADDNLRPLVPLARSVLRMIPENSLLRATWHDSAEQWAAELHQLEAALARVPGAA